MKSLEQIRADNDDGASYQDWCNAEAAKEIVAECNSARRNHNRFNSLHEAYAVILEEVDELWELVRLKSTDRDPNAIRAELRQIGAMALRAMVELTK